MAWITRRRGDTAWSVDFAGYETVKDTLTFFACGLEFEKVCKFSALEYLSSMIEVVKLLFGLTILEKVYFYIPSPF